MSTIPTKKEKELQIRKKEPNLIKYFGEELGQNCGKRKAVRSFKFLFFIRTCECELFSMV